MQREGRDDQFAVSDLVADDPADDDAEAETREAGTVDEADLQRREAEFCLPDIEDAAADGKADARGQNRHESGCQQPLRIRRCLMVFSVALKGFRVVGFFRPKIQTLNSANLTIAPPFIADCGAKGQTQSRLA